MKENFKKTLLYIGIPIILIVAILVVKNVNSKNNGLKYYELVSKFQNNEVSEYSLNLYSRQLKYKLRNNDGVVYRYNVPNVSLFQEDIHNAVIENNKKNAGNSDKIIKYDYSSGSEMSALYSLGPTLLTIAALVFVFVFMTRRMGNYMGGGDKIMGFGKAKIKRPGEDGKKTTFSDVAGADEEKEELSEIVEFLKNPKKFNEIGARIPKGVLLVGPPGTGKTLLARAVAGEAGVPFFSISGSDFVEMYVGVGASRVRDLFEQAKKNSPAIIFIDEIDAVGRQRGAGLGGGHDEREQTLNQLLVEMDGFSANTGVIIIAATNRPDILDKALLRPGRFDRQITVNYPDVKGREAILKVHARGKPLAADVSLKTIAQSTAGFTGADLENLLNEAALLTARMGLKAITQPVVEEATLKVIGGPEKKSWLLKQSDKVNTAYHEAGHAITGYYLPTQDKIHYISIIPRGMALGLTVSLPTDDKFSKYKKELEEEIVMLLGGRIAESIYNGDVSTGASNDIQRATELARNMVVKYGMSEKLGPILYGSSNDEVFLGRDYGHVQNCSEDTNSKIDSEIYRIVEDAYKKGEEILRTHIDKLHLIAKTLIEKEKIDGEEFRQLMEAE